MPQNNYVAAQGAGRHGRSDMDVVMGFDANYGMAAAVSIRSLGLALASDETATVHVLGVELDTELRQRIERSVPESIDIRWYDFDTSQIRDLPVSEVRSASYINQSAYALLFIDRYLPSTVKKVAFLDADTLVRRTLRPLLDVDLGDCAFAAVRDLGCCAIGMSDGVAGWRDMGVDGRLPYFNSGFLVINRATWVLDDIEARCLEYLHRYRASIRYVDQDSLNAAVAGHWHELPPTWNFQADLEWALGGDDATAYGFLPRDSLDEARRDPSIVHFVGARKPWTYEGRTVRFADQWRSVLDDTDWKGQRPLAPDALPNWRRGVGRLARAGRILVGR